MVEIIEVKTKKDIKEFINFPLNLYKNNPYFVPPLYDDEKSIFTDKNVYFKTCVSKFFLAKKDGKVVGRIQGIIQKQYNEIHNEKRLRFTRFDAIDDQEVATALFTALENFGKESGMDTCCGPLGYSDLEREGLLIEGFNELSTFEEQYNYEYYARLIENCGYKKEVDWLEFKLKLKPEKDVAIKKIAERSLRINKLHEVKGLTKTQLINRYGDGIFACLDECYKHLYGTVPFTEEMKKQILSQFKLMINRKYIMVIVDESDKVVAFGLCLPSIGKALQKSGGRLTISALIRLLKSINKPEILDLALIGVLPEYQAKGVNALALNYLMEMMENSTVSHCETNLCLETNDKVQAQWKRFDAVNHKRRRSFIKKL